MSSHWLTRGFVSQALKGGLSGLLVLFAATAVLADDPNWPMFGQNVQNTATTTDKGISVKNAPNLKVKWTFTTGGDVSARAAVVGGVAYFPDWSGNLYAVKTASGSLVWQHQLTDYGLGSTARSRNTPAVVDGRLYLGTQPGAWLLAIDAKTGTLLWKTQLESTDPYAILSTSPAVHNGVVYTGVASLAEGGTFVGVGNIAAQGPRGSAVAVDAINGSIVWKTYMAPMGYYGAGVWGSHPAVDVERNAVYVSTGNNYLHPESWAPSRAPYSNYGDCITDAGNTAADCNAADNYVDAVVALDLDTGAVKWAKSLVTWNQFYAVDGSDDWNVDCIFGGPQCPTDAGPDYDFGSAPNLITYKDGKGSKTIVGAGQKSGIYYALNPDTGAVLWQTQVGPGSALGGMEWGSASDGKRIYVQIANLYAIPHNGVDCSGGGCAGSWSALDPETGQILWQTADPNGAIDIGPMTVANGVVYASSMALSPSEKTMFAMDAATGQIIWSFAAGSSVNAGATIVDGVAYWGSGYTNLGPPYTGNDKFFAFSTK